jgi:hypothetical protein
MPKPCCFMATEGPDGVFHESLADHVASANNAFGLSSRGGGNLKKNAKLQRSDVLLRISLWMLITSQVQTRETEHDGTKSNPDWEG